MSTSLRANVVANFLGQGWNALMGIAFLPIYIEYLGLEAYGLLGVYALIQGWLALLDLGMASTLSRQMALYRGGGQKQQWIADLLRSLETLSLGICAVVAVAIYLAADWLATDWLQLKSIAPATAREAIALMGLIVGLRLVEGLYRGAIIGLQEQVWLNAVGAFVATLRWGGAVAVLAYAAPTVQAYFHWQLAVSLLAVAVLAVRTHRSVACGGIRPAFSTAALRSVFSFAAGVSVSTVLAILLTQVDKLMLSRMLGLEDFGRYTFAATLAGALLQLVIPLSHAYYPRYSELVARGDLPKLAETYHAGAQLAHLILVPVAATLAVFSFQLIDAWSGNRELAENSAYLVSLLAVGTMLNGIMQTPYALTLAYGWSSLSAKLNAAAVLFVVPALLWAVPRFGAIGAAWVWLSLNAGYVLAGVYLVHTRILPDERRRWYVDDLMVPAAAASVVLATAAWLDPRPSLPFIAGAYLSAAAAMALASSRIRPVLRRRFLSGGAAAPR